MSEDVVVTGEQDERKRVFGNAVCLVIKLGRPRTRRAVSSGDIDTGDADKALVKVGKEILDSKTLKRIGAFDMKVRAYLKLKALPAPIRLGAYMVSVANVPEVNSQLDLMRAEREALIDEFVAEYPSLVEGAMSRLGHLANRADYPRTEDLRELFVWDTEYVAFGTPAALKNISKEFFAREEEKARARWTEAAETMKAMLVAEFSGLIGHVADKLSPSEDGQKKVFHKSALEKVSAFISEFKGRDIFDYAELDSIVQKAKSVMSGIDIESVKGDETLRAKVADSFKGIKSQLDTMVINKPKRAVELED